MSHFLETSRYHKTPHVDATTKHGKQVKIVKLRVLPPTKGTPAVTKHDERLDVIAHRQYGNATKFWHIADANTELEAKALVAESGRTINVPES